MHIICPSVPISASTVLCRACLGPLGPRASYMAGSAGAVVMPLGTRAARG